MHLVGITAPEEENPPPHACPSEALAQPAYGASTHCPFEAHVEPLSEQALPAQQGWPTRPQAAGVPPSGVQNRVPPAIAHEKPEGQPPPEGQPS